jgi:hemolysin III
MANSDRMPTTLFDARLGRQYHRPRLRGLLHVVCFEASLVLGTLLIVAAQGTLEITAAAVYAAAVAGLFGTSALYHRGTWDTAAALRMQRIDQLMIVVLIAGTATPPMALALSGTWRVVGLAALWTVSTAAITLRLTRLAASERAVGALYIVLGWVTGAAVPAVWIRFGVAPAVLLLAGGLLYTIGAVGYHRRRPDPNPEIFGYHEVFHVYVAAAAACHYVAIGCFLI